MYPSSIKKLIDVFIYLPGVGEKTAERMAFSVVNFDKERLQEFADSVLEIKNNIKYCKNNVSDNCYTVKNKIFPVNFIIIIVILNYLHKLPPFKQVSNSTELCLQLLQLLKHLHHYPKKKRLRFLQKLQY